VNVDNLGSNQMHQIRVALCGKGVVLKGNNTMIRRWNGEGMGHNEGMVMVRYTMLWLSPVSPSTLCVCYEGVVLLLQRQSTNRRGSHSLTLGWIYVYLCLAMVSFM